MTFILDSGAYSAANSGKPLSLDRYCDFLLDNKAWIDHYISLDVITTDAPEIGAAASYSNYRAMRERGLRPVPVFHFGESISWLKRYLDDGADYIALGGTAVLSSKAKSLEWYSVAWQQLVTADNKPIVRVHAFGETDAAILQAFPWQSADSATWIHVLRTRSTMWNGRRISIDRLSAEELHMLCALVGASEEEFLSAGKVGRTLQTLATAFHYRELCARVRTQQARKHLLGSAGFFSQKASDKEAISLAPFQLYLSVSGFPEGVAVLEFLGHKDILGSFFYFNSAWEAVYGKRIAVQDIPEYSSYAQILKGRFCGKD